MSRFVTVSDSNAQSQSKDLAMKLIKYRSTKDLSDEDKEWLREAQGLTGKSDYGGFLCVVARRFHVVFVLALDPDIESMCNVFCCLLGAVPDGAIRAKAATDFVRAIIAPATLKDDEPRATVRLHLLTIVFNAGISLNLDLHPLLTEILNFALKYELFDLLAQHSSSIVSSTVQSPWDAAARRAILIPLRSIYVSSRRPGDAFTVLKALVTSYRADEVLSDEMVQDALAYAQELLEQPAILVGETVDLPAIKRIRDADAALFKLLEILVGGTVAEFEAHAAAHPSLVKDWAIARKKMNMGLLSALAQKKDSFSFADVEAALHVPAGEVEAAVVEAVANDAIDATIDQLNGTVSVRRFVPRRFGTDEWQLLLSRLEGWKQQVLAVNASAPATPAVVAEAIPL